MTRETILTGRESPNLSQVIKMVTQVFIYSRGETYFDRYFYSWFSINYPDWFRFILDNQLKIAGEIFDYLQSSGFGEKHNKSAFQQHHKVSNMPIYYQLHHALEECGNVNCGDVSLLMKKISLHDRSHSYHERSLYTLG